MARKKLGTADTLTLEPIGEGHYRLFGYVGGQKIRRQGTNLAELEAEKAKLEQDALQTKTNEEVRHAIATWLTPAQLRDAEAAVHELRESKHTLLECARLGLSTLGDGAPVEAVMAFRDYEEHLTAEGCSGRHIENVGQRLCAFFKATGVKMLGEIDSQVIERFCLRGGAAGYTKVGDAAVIRAFLGFCVGRRLLRSSPFAVDMKKLKKVAQRGAERPRILSAVQAEALLKAAIETEGGNHVPFVIFSLWCFIRRAEAERLTVEDVRFEDGKAEVTIRPAIAKTASYRTVTVPANMVGLLRECITKGLLNKEQVGAPLEATWADIREKAGLIKVTRTAPWYNRKVEDTIWQPNIMRHTGASYYHKASGNIVETARQAGHSTDVSFKHYITLATAEDARAFYAVRLSLTPAKAGDKVA